MSAPWVVDMRHMSALDDEEARSYARERFAAQVTADPKQLASALAFREEDDKWLLKLASVLTAIHAGGEQATPLQTLELSIAIQAIADDSARYEFT